MRKLLLLALVSLSLNSIAQVKDHEFVCSFKEGRTNMAFDPITLRITTVKGGVYSAYISYPIEYIGQTPPYTAGKFQNIGTEKMLVLPGGILPESGKLDMYFGTDDNQRVTYKNNNVYGFTLNDFLLEASFNPGNGDLRLMVFNGPRVWKDKRNSWLDYSCKKSLNLLQ
jgi:hypothetical protein